MTGKKFVVAGLLIVSTSCGGGDDLSTAEAPATGQINGMSYVDSIIYGDGSQKLALERRAQDVRLSCMAEAGFEIPLVILDDSTAEREAPPAISQELPFDTYGISQRIIDSIDRPSQSDTFYEDLSSGEQAAYEAASEICGPKIDAAAFPNYERYESLRGQLETKRIEFFNRLSGDAEIVSIHSDWAACMKSNGYNYATPGDASTAAGSEIELELETDVLSTANRAAAVEAEMRIASADSNCRQTTSYANEYEARFLALEAGFVEENATLISDLYEATYGESSSDR